MSDDGNYQQGDCSSARNVARTMHPQSSQYNPPIYHENSGNLYQTPSPPQNANGQHYSQSHHQPSLHSSATRSDRHHTTQSARPPYRPRPSPPTAGGSRPRFCDHGASFDCGHGCHLNTISTTPEGSPSAHHSPSSAERTSRHSSPLNGLHTTQDSVPGRPGHASLPARMAPGPSVDEDFDARYTTSDSTSFILGQGMYAPPYGQLRYASLPDRMARDPGIDPTSDTTHNRRG